VFLLADHFAVSQDEIVDAIHQLHGASFGDYIDSLRVAHAVRLISLHDNSLVDDHDSMLQLAHQCGYLDIDALKRAFRNNMDMDIADWLKENQ
jgi:AraC-like DNA-binding protein